MPNLKSLINSHNQNILRDQSQSTPKTCNCLKKEDCPMNGFCLTKSLLYYATITCGKENYTKLYKGICKTTFKKRYAQTTKSLLTFQPTKTITNFLPNIGHLKQSSLTQKCHGKSKGDTIPTIPFLEDVICT